MSSFPKTVSTLFDEYQIGEQVGQGGVGRVFRAATSDRQPVAIKLIDLKSCSAQTRRRFKNEVNFCHRNTHDSIVKVLDWGLIQRTDVSLGFYVMPFYDSTLDGEMRTGIPPADCMDWISQILDGVEAAHMLGVTHRDLKPKNMLVDTKSRRLVLADFGIAHFSEPLLHTLVATSDQERLANFLYAAPEQRRPGAQVDHRADIFAAGLIINELFTGEIIHGQDSRQIGAVAPAFAYLDPVVQRMTQQAPAARPDSVATIKSEIEFGAHRQLTIQRLDATRTQVVNSSKEDDPLVLAPIAITRLLPDTEKLILELSSEPNDLWTECFRAPRTHSGWPGALPDDWTFFGRRMHVRMQEDWTRLQMQQIISFAKGYVDAANKAYAGAARRLRQQQEEECRRQRQESMQREQERLKRLADLGALEI